MRRLKYKKGRQIIPNNLEYTGIYHEVKPQMQLFAYEAESVDEFPNFELDTVSKAFLPSQKLWFNLHGLNDTALVQNIGKHFALETPVIADILNTNRRTKFETNEDLLFFSVKSILPFENGEDIRIEQISFVLKQGVLLSFQEKKGDFFVHIRERLRNNYGLVRKKSTDYLLYLLLDAVMENFYETIVYKESTIESLLLASKMGNSPETLSEIEKTQEILHVLKRALIPIKEALLALRSFNENSDFKEIDRSNNVYFSRLYHKSLELIEQLDYDLNTLESAINMHFYVQGHKMNQIMKTLTLVSVIFMPLTFIVGIYGMNFVHMPELEYPYAYFAVLGFMFLLTLGMLWYFKRKKWF